MASSRNQKATLLTGSMFALAVVLAVFAGLTKPETRITGTMNGQKIDIPVWLQEEPEYAQKIKDAKVVQGFGWMRLLLSGLALVPTVTGLALVGERRSELDDERLEYERNQKETELLGNVKTAYKVSLSAAMLRKTGEAKIAIHEDNLEMQVDAHRDLNGLYAPEPVKAIAPPIPPEKPALNPFEGMKTPEEYAAEIEKARLGAIEKLPDPTEAAVDPKFLHWENIGKTIMESLADINISILSAGPTGSGKTHTMDKWLRDIRKLYPKSEIWAIAQKADPFCGLLAEGRVQVFQDFGMEASLKYLDKVYSILQERRKTPKNQRAALYDNHPIRLILDDWFSIYQALLNDPAVWRNVKQKLSSIITVGREFNVCLYVCTQSYNLEALGIADDGNIRANLAIICQGFVRIKTDKEGKEKKQGDYTVLLQLLKNQSIIPDKERREALLVDLRIMMLLSKQYQRPILFSAIDEPTLGFPPHIEIQDEIVQQEFTSTNVAVADRNSEEDEDTIKQFTDAEARRWALEFDLKSTDILSDISTEDTLGSHDLASSQPDIGNDIPDISEKNINRFLLIENAPKWFPKSEEIIEKAMLTDRTLFGFIREDLGITNGDRYKTAKPLIAQVIKHYSETELSQKFNLD